MNVATHDAFDRRVQRYVQIASDGLAESQRDIMASYAARGVLQSGPRLKRQAEVRNQVLGELTEWCLSEVAALPGDVTRHWIVHKHSIQRALSHFMTESRAYVSAQAAPFRPGALKAIEEILDKADAHVRAELDEFGAGVWRSRSPRQENSVTNNNVTITNSTVGMVQQAGNHAHQQSDSQIDIGAIQQALDAFERATANAQISDQARAEISVEIETIRPQLKKAVPSAVIVREGLISLRNIVEGVAAGALLTPQFGALMAAALPLVGAG